jgi:tetratricopeptide (TPR) repeat protein
MYSLFLSNMGRHAEALSEIRTAQELDPLTGITVVGPGWTYYYARQYDRAIEQCGKALQRDDSSDSARDCIGTAYLGKGSYAQGLAEFQKLGEASQDEPRLLTSLARSYALTGNKKEAQRLIRQMNAISKRQYVPPYLLAIAYGAEGEKNQAFSSLEKAYRQHDSFLVRLKVDEAMDPLRSDPRFENLLRRMGFSS